jgi:hypothetical protein
MPFVSASDRMRGCEALNKLHFFYLQMQSHSPNKIKELIKIFYLNNVNVQNSGNLQTAYTGKMRKYAELNTEVKQQWQLEAVYTLPATISAIGVIPHMLYK